MRRLTRQKEGDATEKGEGPDLGLVVHLGLGLDLDLRGGRGKADEIGIRTKKIKKKIQGKTEGDVAVQERAIPGARWIEEKKRDKITEHTEAEKLDERGRNRHGTGTGDR